MVVKVAMADHFQFKVMPSIKNFCLLKQGDVHYIGGTDILPAPLGASEEQNAIEALGTASDAEAKHTLIEHNLRLVVYIAKKFDNTGVGVEDLISIGTIGLIKAINSYDKDKNIKLATYASRCIENEILMYLRRNSKIKAEVSIDEPLNVDWDGNELLLSDIIGTDEDIIYRDIETEVECKMLKKAINQLPERERIIVDLRFGLSSEDGEEKTQKEVGVEDLISIGTIGLIKAINSYDKDKNIKLATYASRCIENEILMYLRRNSKIKAEVSIDEPLNVDWDGNELLLSDIIGTDEDIIYRDIETEVECKMLKKAINQLPERERIIVDLRFGLSSEDGEEKTQKEVADMLGISQSYISRLEKKIMRQLRKEMVKSC